MKSIRKLFLPLLLLCLTASAAPLKSDWKLCRGATLETRDGWYQVDKLTKVKRGYLYPIPKNDADFSLWSAINLDGNIKGVKIADIRNIGSKSMKRRHKFFVGKFTKKK